MEGLWCGEGLPLTRVWSRTTFSLGRGERTRCAGPEFTFLGYQDAKNIAKKLWCKYFKLHTEFQ
jgi:hypothetical protein